MKVRSVMTAIGLFVVFWVASTLSGLAALVALLLGRTRQAGDIVHSMDMTLAAVLGWDGRSTVSRECGKEVAEGKPCAFCRRVCAFLDRWLETGHCEKEAR